MSQDGGVLNDFFLDFLAIFSGFLREEVWWHQLEMFGFLSNFFYFSARRCGGTNLKCLDFLAFFLDFLTIFFDFFASRCGCTGSPPATGRHRKTLPPLTLSEPVS